MQNQQPDENTFTSKTIAEYQAMAAQYETSFEIMPYRTHIEEYSVMQAIQATGGVAGREVLDVACGTGHYTRLFRQQGASRVAGVDLSPEMIEVARQLEAAAPMGGISYEVQDATALDLPMSFDLAVGVYLLHYAPSEASLQQMCRAIARHLRPGGHMVAYTLHPDFCTSPGYYEQYKIRLSSSLKMDNGEICTFALLFPEGWTAPITMYYWSREVLTGALQQAGFSDVQWQSPQVSPDGREQYGSELWQAYMDCPHCVVLTATKQ
jgi:SAM-dependent methyltransferase